MCACCRPLPASASRVLGSLCCPSQLAGATDAAHLAVRAAGPTEVAASTYAAAHCSCQGSSSPCRGQGPAGCSTYSCSSCRQADSCSTSYDESQYASAAARAVGNAWAAANLHNDSTMWRVAQLVGPHTHHAVYQPRCRAGHRAPAFSTLAHDVGVAADRSGPRQPVEVLVRLLKHAAAQVGTWRTAAGLVQVCMLLPSVAPREAQRRIDMQPCGCYHAEGFLHAVVCVHEEFRHPGLLHRCRHVDRVPLM